VGTFVDTVDFGRIPPRMSGPELSKQAGLVLSVISAMLDPDLMPWLPAGRSATAAEREAAAVVLADRLCTSVADPIIRNAQEARQLAGIADFLRPLGYVQGSHRPGKPLRSMPAGTFQFRLNVVGGGIRAVRVPVDCVVQPRSLRPSGIPVLIEAKSAGDFTNTNKRRKEESDKFKKLQAALGPDIDYVLFLCGYFDQAYLNYEVAEGMDFVWEHRPEDLLRLGL
jgi:hypothetical protein